MIFSVFTWSDPTSDDAVVGERGQQITVVTDEEERVVLTVLGDGVPIGALDCRADGTVTWGAFDPEGEWLA